MTPFLTVLVALLAIALIVAAIAAAVVALGALAGAAFGWAYVPVAAARYERRQRASLAALDLPPSQTYRPHRDTTTDPAGVESDSYWTEARRVAADAAGDTATTARHEAPLPATVPMPTVDAAAALTPPVPYAVRWDFDPAGPRTVVAERWAGRAA